MSVGDPDVGTLVGIAVGAWKGTSVGAVVGETVLEYTIADVAWGNIAVLKLHPGSNTCKVKSMVPRGVDDNNRSVT